MNFVIVNWLGFSVFEANDFKTFEDAENFLSIELGDKYDSDRQEYFIIEKGN